MLVLHHSVKESGFEEIFYFECSILKDIFGEFNSNPDVYLVSNDENRLCPRLVTNHKEIWTSVEERRLCNYVFQISHELCHYIIRCERGNEGPYISWFEETICEAISMVALMISSLRWDECVLSKFDNGYGSEFEKYLFDFKNDETNGCVRTNRLAECKTMKDLEELNAISEEHREHRMNERDALYDIFMKDLDKVHCVSDYPKYVDNSGLLIDFDTWALESQYPDFIEKIKVIQPTV